MANFKSMLLAATIVAGTVASPAFAQTTQIPLDAPSNSDGALHGAGASSINNIVPRVGNCIGPDQQRGNSSGSPFTSVSAGVYVDLTPALSLDCSTEAVNLQPNISLKYVSTGSGFGRQMWRDFRNDFVGSATPVAGVSNPFDIPAMEAIVGNGTVEAPEFPAVPAQRWSNLQFGFTDTPVSAGDIGTYNSRAAPSAGAAISFPLYLLPVAIAYNARYGVNAAGQDMIFNARGRGIPTVTGAATTAIRLPKAAYCGIFNGTLKNWNEPIFRSANLNTPLFDPSTDNATRWAADGAPIRLVGRMDRSGTTDIFTRHLAAVCNATSAPGVAATGIVGRATYNPGYAAFNAADNKFTNAAESLPYATSTGIDFRSVRSDVNYRPNTSAANVAGTTNSISADYFDGAFKNVGGATFTPATVTSSDPVTVSTGAPTAAPVGNQGSGLFLLANGSSLVAAAVNFAPDYEVAGSTTGAGVKLNGKVTYISSDFVFPSKDAGTSGMTAATLQVGTGTLYANPTAAGAKLAIGTILPPESSATGTYQAGDTRQIATATPGTTTAATRANPVAWAGVLYADSAQTLANPTLGYPITGTTQILLYTCYNGTNRQAMVNHVVHVLGRYGTDGNGRAIARGTFSGTVPTSLGILAQSNIGVVPPVWTNAIINTFLSRSTTDTAAAALNLWIQDRTLPAYQAPVPAVFYGIGTGPAATAARPVGTLFRAAKTNIRLPALPNEACAALPGA